MRIRELSEMISHLSPAYADRKLNLCTSAAVNHGDSMTSDEAATAEAMFAEALADFATGLRKLHDAGGAISLPALEEKSVRAGRRRLSPAGISEVLNGKRFPSMDYAIELVRLLTDNPEEVARWQRRWQDVKQLQRAVKVRPHQDGPSYETVTAELNELRSQHVEQTAELNRLRGQHKDLTAWVAGLKAQAEAAHVLADRLQDALYAYWPTGGVTLAGGHEPVCSVAFHPSGRKISAGYRDGMLRVWDPDAARILGGSLASHAGPVHSVAYDLRGNILAAGGEDGTVRLADPGTGQLIGAPLVPHGPPVLSVALEDCRVNQFRHGEYIRLLAAGDTEGTVRVWADVDNPRMDSGPLRELNVNAAVRSLSFSRYGSLLAIGTDTRTPGTLILWDLDTDEQLEMTLSESPVKSVAFHPSKELLAIGPTAGNVILLRQPAHPLADADQMIADGRIELIDTGGEVTSLAFNPQADSLAICVGETSGPHAVYSYDLAARNNRTGAIEFDYAALAVAFRPDGKLLAIARADGGIRLYGPNAWQMP